MENRQRRIAREEGMRRGSYFFHIEDGFHYNMNTNRDGILYFKCVKYERGCYGRAIYNPVVGFNHTAAHNHAPDPLYPAEMALRRSILQRCEHLHYCSYRDIIDEEGRRFDVDVRVRVPYARMRTPMRNARMSHFPPIPPTLRGLTDILMHPQFRILTMTVDGTDNIYGGSVTDVDGGHHVLFISNRMLDKLKSFKAIHADGTFQVRPAAIPSEQVFAIVAVWSDHVVPLAWALMERKSQNAYTALFRLLRNLMGPDFELTRVVTDFETGQQNAWERELQLLVQGCLWHFARDLLKKMAELGLIGAMTRIAEVRRIIRLCMALPLLPSEHIQEGFLIILEEAALEGRYVFNILLPFFLYLWTTWISRPWLLNRLTVFGSHQRTNNVCESHNNQLRLAPGAHPNIYAFVEALVSLEDRTYVMIVALDEGRQVGRARKRTSIMNDERIINLSNDFINPPGPMRQTIFRFLRSASHLMDNMVDEALH